MNADHLPSDEHDPVNVRSRAALRWLLAINCSWLLILLISNLRDQGPPLPDGPGPIQGFDVRQAESWLEQVFLPEAPHPAGSVANSQVRERITKLVTTWGYEIFQQEKNLVPRLGRTPIGVCNLMFRLEGSAASDDAVLIVAHYDSALFSPGISDDGSGVAIVLELARLLRNQPPPRNDLIFLLTDGEESGLLGAKLFYDEHPWAAQARAVINLEARGTSGPSLMFQTGEPNRWLIELFGRHVSRPRTSSLFFEIYRFLPNDTDFTVFKRAGITGFNFAFISEVSNYHTANDNFKQLSRHSLQHQGQNAWEVLQALLQSDLQASHTGNAVYFDLFGRWLVWWPAKWTLPAAIALLLASLGCSWGLGRADSVGQRQFSLRHLLLRWLANFLIVCVAWAVASGLGYLLAWDARMRSPWPIASFVWLLTYWLAALALLLGLSRVIGPRSSLESHTTVLSWHWLGISLLLAIWLPGASFLFIVPAGFFVLAQALTLFWPRHHPLWLGLSAVALGCLWIPNERLFYDALGFVFPIAVAFRPIFANSILLPWFGQLTSRSAWRLGVGLAVAAVCFAVTAIALNRWEA